MINKVVLLIVFFVTVVSSNFYGQEITVIDKITQERIPGVLIYSKNPKVNVRGNAEGRFQLNSFQTLEDENYFDQ